MSYQCSFVCSLVPVNSHSVIWKKNMSGLILWQFTAKQKEKVYGHTTLKIHQEKQP